MRLSPRSGASRWLLAAMMLVLPSACASAGSSNSTSSSTTAATVSTGPASSQSSGTTTTTTTATRVPRRASLGPLQTVEHYWRAIAGQNFQVAYRDLAPGAVPQSETTFVSQEQQTKIGSANFSGSLTSASKTAATVAVTSLTTTDGQFGCRTWSGSYQLTRLNGRWRIARASITPSPCQGSPAETTPPATTAESKTGGPGSGGCHPLTDSGNCYEPGEFCRDTDHGTSGTAGDGEAITCEDNDGWRWDPS